MNRGVLKFKLSGRQGSRCSPHRTDTIDTTYILQLKNDNIIHFTLLIDTEFISP